MDGKNYINRSQTLFQSGNVWFCSACGKSNVRQSRFCGGCGKIALNAIEKAIPVNHISAFSCTAVNEQAADSVSIKEDLPADISAQKKCSLTDAFLKKALGKKLNKKRVKKLFAAMAVSACLFSGVWLHASISKKQDYVKWGDFRAFVSQQLVISPNELDSYMKEISSAGAGDKITVIQVAMLETALKTKLEDSSIKLFPNPFFGNVGTNAGSVIFSDVAMDHPVYVALKPLLELGINCCDKDLSIRPYDKIKWSEWNRIVEDLTTMLGVEGKDLAEKSTGEMSMVDLKFSLANLRRKLCIGGIEKLSNSIGSGFPNRMDALSSLAALILELNAG